eukprot:2403161-Pyramimonas_sp.AAC.1
MPRAGGEQLEAFTLRFQRFIRRSVALRYKAQDRPRKCFLDRFGPRKSARIQTYKDPEVLRSLRDFEALRPQPMDMKPSQNRRKIEVPGQHNARFLRVDNETRDPGSQCKLAKNFR